MSVVMNADANSETLVSGLFECIDGKNWRDLEAYFHNEVVYERPGYNPLVGKERVMEFYKRERIVENGSHSVECIVTNGTNIACWGTFEGDLRSGDNVEVRFADVYEVNDGAIVKRRTYFYQPSI